MKYIKLFETFLIESQLIDSSELQSIIDGLDTLEGFMEINEINFKERVSEIRENPSSHYTTEEEYYRIEKEHNDLDNAYQEICKFFRESPSDIIFLWNSNNIGGSSDPGAELYCELIDKLFGEYFDMGNAPYDEVISVGPLPKDYLGSPKKTIVIQEKDVYYHNISMYQSTDGLKFVSWGWGVDMVQTVDWICTRSLVESALSRLGKNT
jgi:hypothetical protein